MVVFNLKPKQRQFPAPVCLFSAMHLSSKQLFTVLLPNIILVTFGHRLQITSAAHNKGKTQSTIQYNIRIYRWSAVNGHTGLRLEEYYLWSLLNQQNRVIDLAPHIANSILSPLGSKDGLLGVLMSLSWFQYSNKVVTWNSPDVRNKMHDPACVCVYILTM